MHLVRVVIFMVVFVNDFAGMVFFMVDLGRVVVVLELLQIIE